MSKLPRWLKDPLVHFLVAGAALFMALPRETDLSSQVIAVSRGDLIGYMQAKARLYDGQTFEQAYDALIPEQRREMLDDYVRQEALYREARAISLDEADPLVRSRLVQQMDLLLRDQAMSGAEISPAEVEAYFREHAADYAQPATATFTHVFIDGQKHGTATAQVAARELQALRSGNVAPEDALGRGDRFPYQRNYSAMTQGALVPELGEDLAAAAFRQPVWQWTGPFRSPLGLHLLRVASRRAAQQVQLDQLRDLITRDALQAKRNRLGDQAVQQVVAGYRLEPARDLGELGGPAR
ncbi:MAG: peptidylprolyl isomerase [Alteraurantiacibacter sp.]